MVGRRSVWCAAFVGLAFVAGCGGDDDGGGGGGSGGSGDPIEFGYIADLSGPYLAYGYPALNGAQVAVDQLNEAGGIEIDGEQRQVSLKVCQANSDDAQAAACAREFVRTDGIKVVMGGVGQAAPVIGSITDPAGALYFATGSSILPQMENLDHAFSVLPSTDIRTSLSVAAVKRVWPEVQSVAFVVSDEPTSALLPPLVEEFEGAGYDVVAQEKYSAGGDSQDLTPLLTNVRSEQPDLIFGGWTSSEVAPVVKANAEVRVTDKIYTYTGPGTCEQLKSIAGDQELIANDSVGADIDHPQTDAGRAFTTQYKRFIGPNGASEFKNEANTTNQSTALWYADVVPLIANAMTQAATTDDSQALTEAILNTEVTEGIQGNLTIGEDREAKQGLTHCTLNVDGPGQTNSFFLPPQT